MWHFKDSKFPGIVMRCLNEKFVDLGSPRRLWVVPAIHGDLKRLVALHDHIATRFAIGDRIIYLGNYLGIGSYHNDAVVDELLAFRAALLAKPGMEPSDIVHLRGPAEEAWQRLLRLQFAPVPAQALNTYLNAGVESYLRLYGVTLTDAQAMTRADSITITRWTNQLRLAQRQTPGHEPLMCSMRRAAVTKAPAGSGQRILFVPAGFDSTRSLEDQGDHLWFGDAPFEASKSTALLYARIVRGFDAARGGIKTEGTTVTLDGGCGFGGPLACGCFNTVGQLIEVITVGGPGAFETKEKARESDEPTVETFEQRDAPAHQHEPMALSA